MVAWSGWGRSGALYFFIERIFGYFSGIQCEVLDVTNNAAVEAFAAKIDKVDVLFNCAG